MSKDTKSSAYIWGIQDPDDEQEEFDLDAEDEEFRSKHPTIEEIIREIEKINETLTEEESEERLKAYRLYEESLGGYETQKIEEKQPQKELKCECGAHAVGSSYHYDWCEMKKKEG